MSKEPNKCGNCKFWRHDSPQTKIGGTCHKHPPVIYHESDGIPWCQFPWINFDGWCGEYESDR